MKCIVCKNNKFVRSKYLVIDKYPIYQCQTCGLTILKHLIYDPYWDQINEYVYTNQLVENGLKTKYEKYLKIIKENALNNRLLDVGSGTGLFVHTAGNHHFETTGLEPSINAVKVARKRYPDNKFIQNFPGPNCDLPQNFGTLTAWDVIGRTSNPEKFL